MNDDEIIFTGEHKNFKLGVRYDLNGKSEKEVAGALEAVTSAIEEPAFVFAGIDTKKIAAFAKTGKGLKSVYEFLENTQQKVIKEELGKSIPKPELMPAAESYFINKLLTNAGLEFRVKYPAPKPTNEPIEDCIAFIGKYQSWIAIKKLGMEKVQDYEVSGILAGISHTAVNKAFDFAKANVNEDVIAEVTKAKRKSYSNLGAALRELEPKLNDNKAYLICKVCETIGYKPYPSPEMLTDAYPDIKPPKVKGRKPKG